MPSANKSRIVIFGASGRVGQLLVRAFNEKGHSVIGVGRRKDILANLPCQPVVRDLVQNSSQDPIVSKGDIVINAAHARFTEAILALCPRDISRLVVIGSTRYLTRFPDRKAEEVVAAAQALKNSALPWVMLHPTMIYGAQGENNVQRMAALIRRFHLILLPNGGRALIQPIHVGDVVKSMIAACLKSGLEGQTIYLGGPEAVSYRLFLEEIANAAGTWVRIVPLPLSLLHVVAATTRVIPGIPSITGAEVRRLTEDKAVDITTMKNLLGVSPRGLQDGLAETFTKPS